MADVLESCPAVALESWCVEVLRRGVGVLCVVLLECLVCWSLEGWSVGVFGVLEVVV